MKWVVLRKSVEINNAKQKVGVKMMYNNIYG